MKKQILISLLTLMPLPYQTLNAGPGPAKTPITFELSPQIKEKLRKFAPSSSAIEKIEAFIKHHQNDADVLASLEVLKDHHISDIKWHEIGTLAFMLRAPEENVFRLLHKDINVLLGLLEKIGTDKEHLKSLIADAKGDEGYYALELWLELFKNVKPEKKAEIFLGFLLDFFDKETGAFDKRNSPQMAHFREGLEKLKVDQLSNKDLKAALEKLEDEFLEGNH